MWDIEAPGSSENRDQEKQTYLLLILLKNDV